MRSPAAGMLAVSPQSPSLLGDEDYERTARRPSETWAAAPILATNHIDLRKVKSIKKGLNLRLIPL